MNHFKSTLFEIGWSENGEYIMIEDFLKFKEYLNEAQNMPRKGDWFETKEYDYFPITSVNFSKKQIVVPTYSESNKKTFNIIYDIFNLKAAGNKGGRMIWKLKT